MWYTVSLIFRAEHVNSTDETPVWEERLILLKADTEAEARLLAERMGKDGEHSYYVSKKDEDLLRWSFVGVEKVYSIDDDSLAHGTELFTRFVEDDVARALRTAGKS